jgi:hypothetical protein
MSIIHPDTSQVDAFGLGVARTILRREARTFEANARQCGGDTNARDRQMRIVETLRALDHDLTEVLEDDPTETLGGAA